MIYDYWELQTQNRSRTEDAFTTLAQNGEINSSMRGSGFSFSHKIRQRELLESGLVQHPSHCWSADDPICRIFGEINLLSSSNITALWFLDQCMQTFLTLLSRTLNLSDILVSWETASTSGFPRSFKTAFSTAWDPRGNPGHCQTKAAAICFGRFCRRRPARVCLPGGERQVTAAQKLSQGEIKSWTISGVTLGKETLYRCHKSCMSGPRSFL